jgi:hypothetical protein
MVVLNVVGASEIAEDEVRMQYGDESKEGKGGAASET